MKAHPTIGADAIEKAMNQAMSGADDDAIDQAPGAFSFLRVAQEI